jgi:hypothetical protein
MKMLKILENWKVMARIIVKKSEQLLKNLQIQFSTLLTSTPLGNRYENLVRVAGLMEPEKL